MGKWFKRILYIIIAILLVIGIVSLWRSCSKSKTEDYVIQARTYIDFDLDKLPTQVVGDTLYVQLPPEEVTPHEIGYNVIDVHPLRKGFTMPTLTAEQENRAKRRVPQRLINEVYRSGYIRNARQQAREELARFLAVAYPTVIVVDRYPDGVRDTFFADTVYIDHRQM